MIRILSSDVMHPTLLIGAKCFHQLRGESRVYVPKLYTVAYTEDGSGADIFLLTRYIDKEGTHKSAMLAWDQEQEAVVEAVCVADRAEEQRMLVLWERGMNHNARQ